MGKSDDVFVESSRNTCMNELSTELFNLELKNDLGSILDNNEIQTFSNEEDSSEESGQDSDTSREELTNTDLADQFATISLSTTTEEHTSTLTCESDKSQHAELQAIKTNIGQSLAGVDNDGEESDEDNENVVIEDWPHIKATSTKVIEHKDEPLLDRGIYKGVQSQYGRRYNPMQDDAYGIKQQTIHNGSQQHDYVAPLYNSPLYNPACTATNTAPYHSSDNNAQEYTEVCDLSATYDSNAAAAAGDWFGFGGLTELNAVADQLEINLLSPKFLDALDDAVTLSEGTPSDSCDDSSSSVQLIMDSLRSIDRTELDYIAPASPGLTYDDLEEELAVCSDLCGEYALSPSPPLSSPSPSLPSTPQSPDPVLDCGRFCETLSSPPQDARTAVTALQELCNCDVIRRAAVRVSCQRPEDLCCKDTDGDTCYMIVVCKPCGDPNFYENLLVLQQRLQRMRVCCDRPLEVYGDGGVCPLCGGESWRTPLSDTNNAGDTVLSCAVKMRHPEVVINFLCAGLAACEADVRRVFDDEGRRFFVAYAPLYPVLNRFL